MNIKKYLLIVFSVTLIFAIFAGGILFFDMYYGTFGSGANMPDGTIDEHVEGLEDVEKSQPYNILALGIDVEAKLTDVMMLCQVDPVEKTANLLSIPRDTKVKIGSRSAKINSAFNHGGIEQVIKSVKELTGLPVNHYILINTAAFRDIIDALGGVEFNVPRDMNYEDPVQNLYIHLKAGMQVLDGDKAEQLVRFRRYPNGDIGRIAVQQDLLQAIVEQKLSAAYIMKIPEVYGIIHENASSDMSIKEMIGAGKQLLSAKNDGSIVTHTVPGEGRMIGEVSYFVHYEQELKNLVEENFTKKIAETVQE